MFFLKTQADVDRFHYLQQNDPYLTPVHEAGHAVASILLKRRFSYVRVYKHSYLGARGCVRNGWHCWSFPRKNKKHIGRRIVQIYQAGEIAEVIHLMDRGVNIGTGEGEGEILCCSRGLETAAEVADDDMIDVWCKNFNIDQDEQLELFIETTEMINLNWEKVVDVAMALKERRRLGYFEVRRIVLGAVCGAQDTAPGI